MRSEEPNSDILHADHSVFTASLLEPRTTSTGGCWTVIVFSGIAPPSAGETSPAQVGLTPVEGPAVEVARTPSGPLTLRKVSDSLPSSVAMLIFSACWVVTSAV